MEDNNLSDDVLIARAAAAHIGDNHQPNPCLRKSKVMRTGKNIFVELFGEDESLVGLYQYHGSQLRRK